MPSVENNGQFKNEIANLDNLEERKKEFYEIIKLHQ